jgi:hypothetical protein
MATWSACQRQSAPARTMKHKIRADCWGCQCIHVNARKPASSGRANDSASSETGGRRLITWVVAGA